MEDHYQWADLFLLPSVCEGSATVCYEALANGLPVICTPNTGAIVRDGVDGYVVPIRSVEPIVEAIRDLVSTPERYRSMSEQANQRAEEEGSLGAYAERLTEAVQRAFTEIH
jgi:glycosyltransferase involved in cell wall biosynthesis